jgi:hypothetical protein
VRRYDYTTNGLVARLDEAADARRGRLRRHALDGGAPSVLARAVHDLITREYVDPPGAAAIDPLEVAEPSVA